MPFFLLFCCSLWVPHESDMFTMIASPYLLLGLQLFHSPTWICTLLKLSVQEEGRKSSISHSGFPPALCTSHSNFSTFSLHQQKGSHNTKHLKGFVNIHVFIQKSLHATFQLSILEMTDTLIKEAWHHI